MSYRMRLLRWRTSQSLSLFCGLSASAATFLSAGCSRSLECSLLPAAQRTSWKCGICGTRNTGWRESSRRSRPRFHSHCHSPRSACGEEDVGVKEEPVNGGGLFGRAVGNGVRIEAELFDFAAGAAVVGNACGSGKKEFGLALRRVFFDGDDGGGAKQDAVRAGFGGDERAFVETETLAELRRDDDGAAFADFGGFHR